MQENYILIYIFKNILFIYYYSIYNLWKRSNKLMLKETKLHFPFYDWRKGFGTGHVPGQWSSYIDCRADRFIGRKDRFPSWNYPVYWQDWVVVNSTRNPTMRGLTTDEWRDISVDLQRRKRFKPTTFAENLSW